MKVHITEEQLIQLCEISETKIMQDLSCQVNYIYEAQLLLNHNFEKVHKVLHFYDVLGDNNIKNFSLN